MDPLLKRLQHRDGVPVVLLWPPSELEPALQAWAGAGTTVHRRMRGGSAFVLAGDDRGHLSEQRAPELGKVPVGRSCVRFTKVDDLDLGALADLVRGAAHQPVVDSSTASG